MTENADIFAVLRAAVPDLKRRWPIRSLAVFGSVARGEAVRHLPEQLEAANPDIPWTTMAAMRNRIAHAYFGIDDTILFTTIAEEVTKPLPRVEVPAREHDVQI